MAEQNLIKTYPVAIWTDMDRYLQGDVVRISGTVSHASSQDAITIKVVGPYNDLIFVDQISLTDNTFESSVKTDNWLYAGVYIVTATYGNSKSDNTRIGFTPTTNIILVEDASTILLRHNGQTVPIPYEITSGSVTGVTVDRSNTSLVFGIDSAEGGVLTLDLPSEAIGGAFFVLVDGEESNDAEIEGGMVTIPFYPGTEQVEVIGKYVIPEFGTIALMILALAIVSVIAVSARSKIIVPRY